MGLSTMGKKSRGRFPLHITISTLFIFLIVVFGGILGWYNYSKTSQILISTTDQLFDQLSTELSLNQVLSRRPVVQAVSMLGHSEVSRARTLEQRLKHLPEFSAALHVVEEMNGLQVGYNNGDFFIVRSLNSPYMREQFSAPDGAFFAVDNITAAEDGKRYLERLWFSETLVELQRAERVQSSYDPRVRPWYRAAISSNEAISVDPYLFYFTKQVGITLSKKSPEVGVVVAGDITLESLSNRIAAHKETENSEIVLFHTSGKVVAYHDTSKLVAEKDADSFVLATVKDLGNELLDHIVGNIGIETSVMNFTHKNVQWLGGVRQLQMTDSEDYYLLFVSPKKELLHQATNIQKRAVIISIVLVLLTIPLTWVAARLIATPMRLLAREVEQINRFDFSNPITNRSVISEVDDLAVAMGMMKETITKFLTLINALHEEQNFDDALQLITRETMAVSGSDGAATYLVEEKSGRLYPAVWSQKNNETETEVVLPEFTGGSSSTLFASLQDGLPVILTEKSEDHETFVQFTSLLNQGTGAALDKFVVFPLQNRDREGIGLLLLFFSENETVQGDSSSNQEERIAFLRAFSGMAAVSLESRRMLKMQKELLESFVKLLAGAIDSKSPYTGGHCQRVPVLTKMLAEKACDVESGPYKDFTLNEDEWEALHIASWLHDCGKVTTPEYVVDKSTKLETIYDRIHEVRMRFEVLYRDAQLDYWQGRAKGEDEEQLNNCLQKRLDQLVNDFDFVAECNLGGEFMAPERVERLEKIGNQTWQRHFDDRLGVSWEERQRKEKEPAPSLPVTENLLSDKQEHLIEHSHRQDDQRDRDSEFGFKLMVPKYLYNRGELYNLTIARGTLSNEERYKINDHIVQTIVMLKRLPYPSYLQDVPEIAGGHHEKIDGTGYPRCLKGDEMLPQAKMMVIADIFEALTASDRPYKKPKMLSEAIRILGFMEKDNHIDPELFKLFLGSGVYLEYAKEYLHPDQIDEVDIGSYIKES